MKEPGQERRPREEVLLVLEVLLKVTPRFAAVPADVISVIKTFIHSH